MKYDHSKLTRKLCRGCQERRAVSCYKGRFAWRPAHTLCQKCWRAEMDRSRAAQPIPEVQSEVFFNQEVPSHEFALAASLVSQGAKADYLETQGQSPWERPLTSETETVQLAMSV